VLGAIIDLGNCLDLITRKYAPDPNQLLMLKSQIKAIGGKMPVNADAKGDKNSDKLVRKLDCAVVNYVHEIAKEADLPILRRSVNPI